MPTSVFTWYPAMAVSSAWGRKNSEEEYWDSGILRQRRGRQSGERSDGDGGEAGAGGHGILQVLRREERCERARIAFRSWRVVHGPAGRGPESVAEERVVHRE